MKANQTWQQAFEAWEKGLESTETIEKLIKGHNKLGIDIEAIQSCLSRLHTHLDSHHLDPKYLPLTLLLNPEDWDPRENGINAIATLGHHGLSSLDQLLTSGTLRQILNGNISLYSDLPAIPIRAYADGLNKPQRQNRRRKKISMLEHLATEGWHGFRQRQPIATGLDRYHPVELPTITPNRSSAEHLLLVFNGSRQQAESLAVQGGWESVICCSLADTNTLQKRLATSTAAWISICHGDDVIACGAKYALAKALANAPLKTLATCDDVILNHKYKNAGGYEHRQYRSPISAIRLFTRGGVGGLLTISQEQLKQCQLQSSYSCLETFRIDCLLQIMDASVAARHCHQALVKSSSHTNPCLPEQGWPSERCPLTQQQLEEINKIRNKHAKILLVPEATVPTNPLQPGCHDITHPVKAETLISILIPFRDQVHLTQACVKSIQFQVGSNIPYEIILIDNGSNEQETSDWITSVTNSENIQYLRIDEAFNYSRLNNKARKLCKGTHLLFLNNDIEFRSDDCLKYLLDPFAHPQVSAVGSRLYYPDGSIQHQGVVIVPDERRCVLEPGKHLKKGEILSSLLPLNSQDEFSAASAACLMVKADHFDAIGGFDENLAVVFNDVDLCLRLRHQGKSIVVTPHPVITHHESVSRGKDLTGPAWTRHQQEQGHLRLKHQDHYQHGDPLTSPLLHHHSNRFEPAPLPLTPIGPAREQVLYSWTRSITDRDKRIPLIFAQYEKNADAPVRADILELLKQYRKYFYVQVVAATPSLIQQNRQVKRLKHVCDGLIIRRNEGYDYGSWMTGLSFCRDRVEQKKSVVLTNDSFFGPVRPLQGLISRLNESKADMVGLTDDLMYQPHLQSPFMAFRAGAIECSAFWDFWNHISRWDSKRAIVKNYEVGLSTLLKKQGLKLESLYTKNSNGNILHAEWKSLIEKQGFPFIKTSLLRENPRQIDISEWEEVVNKSNRQLARQIKRQLTSWEKDASN